MVMGWFATVLGIGLFQLVPLPPLLLDWLAPIKQELVALVHSIAPEATPKPIIAMVPEFHQLLLAKLVTDLYMVVLILVGPRPGRRLFRFWLRLLTFIVSVLMIISGRNLMPDLALLEPYRETFGGLVNTNHFALTTVVLILLCLQSFTQGMQHTIKEWKSSAGHRSNVLTSAIHPLLDLFLLDLCFLAFRYADSRSGVALLVIGVIAFFGQVAMTSKSEERVGWAPKLTLAGLLLSIFLLSVVPLGQSYKKFEKKGLNWGQRMEAMQAGAANLRELPWLGTGLGSTHVLLPGTISEAHWNDPVWTDYHNDYIQVAVELGLPGILATGLLLILLWQNLDHRRHKHEHRYFLIASRCVALVILVHSLVSFPIRVPAIRLLAIVILCAAARLNRAKKGQNRYSSPVLWCLPIFVAACAYLFGVTAAPRPQHADSPEARYAWHYGMRFNMPLIEANYWIGQAADFNTELADAKQAADRAEALAIDYLKRTSFSVDALNTVIMARVLRARMTGGEWHHLLEQAQRIQTASHPDNASSRLSEVFTLSMYEGHLTTEQAQRLAQLRATYSGALKKRMNDRRQLIESE